ncbi:MAG: sulfite exporter TauE/SafE family protein [Halorhodospira sp.]
MVLLAGTVVQGSIGFGVALLGAPILYWVDPLLVPGPMLVAGMAAPLMILLRERRSLDTGGIRWAIPGQLSCAGLAGLMLARVDEAQLSLLFGTLVLLAVVLSLVAGAPRPTGGRLLAGGLSSGFMATATSIGGPPLALAYQGVHGSRLRASLSAVFVVGALGSLGTLWLIGRFGVTELLLGLSLLPGVAVGFWISAYTARLLDRRWLRGAVLGISAIAGWAAVMQALL